MGSSGAGRFGGVCEGARSFVRHRVAGALSCTPAMREDWRVTTRESFAPNKAGSRIISGDDVSVGVAGLVCGTSDSLIKSVMSGGDLDSATVGKYEGSALGGG